MAVPAETELRVLRASLKKALKDERIATITVESKRVLGKLAQEYKITTEEAREIFRPVIALIIEEVKESFDIK